MASKAGGGTLGEIPGTVKFRELLRGKRRHRRAPE